MERAILHCDCDNYYASVEAISSPELANVPMAVCGNPKSRKGVILAKNELAKGFGILTAEPVWQAVKKCPNITLVPPSFDLYKHYSLLINKIYNSFTDQVEVFSIDESWLDVTNSYQLFGDGKQIADKLRKRIKDELHLTISVGVSFNKTFSKIASNMHKPNATTVITQENFREILYPKPVETLLYVGKSTARQLKKHNIHTIGDVANSDVKKLEYLLGKAGIDIYIQAKGRENDRVRNFLDPNPIKSIGKGMTFSEDLTNHADMASAILLLSDKVGSRLRRKKLVGSTVQLQIKDSNFKSISRQLTINPPTQSTSEIYDAAINLLNKNWKADTPVRLFSITMSNLEKEDALVQQLSFYSNDLQIYNRQLQVEKSMDLLRQRYGSNALTYGTLVKSPSEHDKDKISE